MNVFDLYYCEHCESGELRWFVSEEAANKFWTENHEDYFRPNFPV